mgnify:CR=1 FL=1
MRRSLEGNSLLQDDSAQIKMGVLRKYERKFRCRRRAGTDSVGLVTLPRPALICCGVVLTRGSFQWPEDRRRHGLAYRPGEQEWRGVRMGVWGRDGTHSS